MTEIASVTMLLDATKITRRPPLPAPLPGATGAYLRDRAKDEGGIIAIRVDATRQITSPTHPAFGREVQALLAGRPPREQPTFPAWMRFADDVATILGATVIDYPGQHNTANVYD